jgi:hypothetical protein
MVHEGMKDVAHGVRLRLPNTMTDEAEMIMFSILPEWSELFLQNNWKYRHARDLGARGVFPDVNRKVGILEARVWEGVNDGVGESTDEVIMDLIGHLFLMLAKHRVKVRREEIAGQGDGRY